MLSASRISVGIELLPLVEGSISITTAQLFGTHVTLYKSSADAPLNIQFMVDSLASRDTTSTTSPYLRINSLIVRHSSIRFDQLDAPLSPDRLNLHHLLLNDISSHIVLKTLTNDSLNLNVKRLSFREQSGLAINRLALKIAAGRTHATLSDFELRMPGTSFQLGELTASYRFHDSHLVMPSLHYNGSILPSTITLSDLACLLPSLQTFNSTLSVASHFHGEADNLAIPELLVSSTTDDISFDISGKINNLQQPKPTWQADINDLTLSAKTANFISQNIKGEHTEVPAVLTRLGTIHTKGHMSGQGLYDFQAHHQISSDAGEVVLNFVMDGQRQFKGRIDTKGINLRRLLDDERLGQLATAIDLNGQLPANSAATVVATGVVEQFDYNGYSYRNMDVDGSYNVNDIHGHLAMNDPNIKFNIDGSLERDGKKNNVKFTAQVENFSPQATNLSKLWSDASFSGNVEANFVASNINDAEGTLDLTNFTMLSPLQKYEMDELHIESGYNDKTHFVTLHSDFGEAEITGLFDYETLFSSFTNFVAAKLPTLPGLPSINPHTKNDFTINATLRKSDFLQQLFKVPLVLDEPLELHGAVNDPQRQITLQVESPHFYYHGNEYRQAQISISSPDDSLHCNMSIHKIMDNGNNVQLQLTSHAHNNLLSASLAWDNHDTERMSGELNAMANFDTTFDGQRTAYVRIMPSHLNVRNTIWNVEPANIVYAEKHLEVSHFAVRHDEQYLTVDGIASELADDSLSVNMKDIDVEYVLNLVNFDAVTFSGHATGGGCLRAVFGNFAADAQLEVSQFKFQQGRMGTLTATVDWNRTQEQIDIHAKADDGPDAQTLINGYVSPARDSINLIIEAHGTHLDFAQSFTSSFISHIDGHAHGAVNLIGPLSAINLTGELVLNGHATVSTLGCTYELRNDTLRCVPNEMEFVDCHIYDAGGHTGILTGGIHHKDLTRLTYDIFVNADNLLAYDFHEFGDNTFYGTVYATGDVAIRGRANEVRIEGNVTPQRGTDFYYNAATPDAIADQEFIEWGEKRSTRNGETNEPTSTKHSEPPRDFRSDLYLTLHINTNPNAALHLLMDERTNDYITLRGNGVLQANFYNKGGFQMFGTYRVSEGTYGITIQDIIKKNFTFQDGGTIVFGGDPYDATLNLQAIHIVNGVSLSDLNVGRSFSNTVRVNCLMNITGQPRAPIVDFDIDMPNVNADEKQMVRSLLNSENEMNQQVIYLLAVGRFYPQGANNASEDDNQQQNSTSLAMQSLLSGTLSGQINSVLNQLIKNDNWNFGANISTGDEGWNNAEYEGIVSGRMLNNRLLINGQFGYRDNATQTSPSFIGDFDIRYLLFPNGNLALKVYNQTNDRYFTRSSLNTQGIGIIMKKDFNGLGDLFGIKKKKGDAKKKKSSISKQKKQAARPDAPQKSEPHAEAGTDGHGNPTAH